MSDIELGSVVKVRFGTTRPVVKFAKVIAHKAGTESILIESNDGSTMATAIPAKLSDDGSQYVADSLCSLGHKGYTRQSAAKALGFKGLKLN